MPTRVHGGEWTVVDTSSPRGPSVGDGDELLSVESLPLGFLRVARELELGATRSRADVARIAAHVELTQAPLVRISPGGCVKG